MKLSDWILTTPGIKSKWCFWCCWCSAGGGHWPVSVVASSSLQPVRHKISCHQTFCSLLFLINHSSQCRINSLNNYWMNLNELKWAKWNDFIPIAAPKNRMWGPNVYTKCSKAHSEMFLLHVHNHLWGWLQELRLYWFLQHSSIWPLPLQLFSETRATEEILGLACIIIQQEIQNN